MVDFDITESIVVVAKNFIAIQEIRSYDCILYIHGEIIAYRQNRQVKLGTHRNEFHIHRKRRITSDVYVFMFSLDDKTARISSVTAVRKRTGMNSIYIFQFPKIEIQLPP